MNWNWKESAEDILGIVAIAAVSCLVIWLMK